VAHDQQPIQQTKGHGRNDKQIHRGNTIPNRMEFTTGTGGTGAPTQSCAMMF
jgi:hypothetical protein